ncbi:hypothetical protein C4577_06185 [Candidatus Parcubacteria bacterium]|nr:MAG: hypothetical protein C4577_06185 [Candidatus Parcubacteria bacterium]
MGQKRREIKNMERQESYHPDTNEGINNNQLLRVVKDRIVKLGIRPNENLGQHFLVDQASIDLLAQSVHPGNTVIEVGTGVGQLTEALAEKAGKVISIEIDQRYEPILTDITNRYPNIQVIFGDAVALKLQDLIPKQKDGEGVQIVANLPFHITEPFLHKIVGLPIENVTLVVGQRLALAIKALSEDSPDFGQLTLLAQTFFDINVLSTVEKQKSFPVPRTDSVIIRLTPKEEHEFRSNKRDFLFRRLFLTAKRNPLVKNCLKEGLIEFERVKQMGTLSKKEHNHRLRSSARVALKRLVDEYNHSRGTAPTPQKPTEEDLKQLSQNQARSIIDKMNIPESILSKPFEQLNNNELEILSKALR